MTDGYISDRELKCSDCYIRNSCTLNPSTCNKQLHVFDAEGLAIHDAKVRADAIDELKPFVHFNYKGKKFLFVCAEDFNKLSFVEQLKEKKNEHTGIL